MTTVIIRCQEKCVVRKDMVVAMVLGNHFRHNARQLPLVICGNTFYCILLYLYLIIIIQNN